MLLVLLLGCLGPSLRIPGPLSGLGRAPFTERERAPVGAGHDIAAAAESFLGHRALVALGKSYRFDCSGFVEASLAKAGLSVSGSSAAIFELAVERGVLHRRSAPDRGDVAFFDDTYDRNRNGRVDDPLSHVAIVESTDPDGTIHLIHVGSGSVGTFVMNLRRRADRTDDEGNRINDRLRVERRSDPPGTRYLAAELSVGFGSFWKLDRRRMSAR